MLEYLKIFCFDQFRSEREALKYATAPKKTKSMWTAFFFMKRKIYFVGFQGIH